MASLRELVFHSPDPQKLAGLMGEIFDLTIIRWTPDLTTLTDGYMLINITKNNATNSNVGGPTLDHLGFCVDDVEENSSRAACAGCQETPRSYPAARMYSGPEGWDFEIRRYDSGWDRVIAAHTQLQELMPVPPVPPVVPLEVDTTGDEESGFVRIARLGELPPGSAGLADLDGEAVLVLNVDGSYCAVQDQCPHVSTGRLSQGARDGHILECPIHESRFNALSGAVLNPPARQALKTFEVAVKADYICLMRRQLAEPTPQRPA